MMTFHPLNWEMRVLAISDVRKNIEALMLQAAVFQKMGKKKKAAKTYEKVLKLDGTNSKAVKALKKLK